MNDSEKSKTKSFGCRFKIVKCAGIRKYKLIPLNEDINNYPVTPTHHQNRLGKLKLTKTPGSENEYAVKQITPGKNTDSAKIYRTNLMFEDENCNTPQRRSKWRNNNSDNSEIPVKRCLMENDFNIGEEGRGENRKINM